MGKLGDSLSFIPYSNQSIVIGFDSCYPGESRGRWGAEDARAWSLKHVGRLFIHYSKNEAIILVFDNAIVVTQEGSSGTNLEMVILT